MKEVIMKVPSFSADYPKAPIYVADLVRCKECKYADKCSQNVAMRDTYQMYEKINFCSVGERREP